MAEIISSLSNKKIKTVIDVRDHAKTRRTLGLFVTEGLRMFEETPDELIDTVFCTKKFYQNYTDRIRLSKLNMIEVSDEVFRKMSDTVSPQGVLCLVKCPNYSVNEIKDENNAFILMLENIQDPGNLGTMIRTCEGAGITGIIMSDNTVDIFSPKVIRSTMGAIYRMPFAYTKDLYATMGDFKKSGVRIHAAALGTDSDYTKADYSGKIAILIGNEGNGLTKSAIDGASNIVTIPMGGKLESLNAAVSAAIIMYEARRQRNI